MGHIKSGWLSAISSQLGAEGFTLLAEVDELLSHSICST